MIRKYTNNKSQTSDIRNTNFLVINLLSSKTLIIKLYGLSDTNNFFNSVFGTP